MDKTDLLTPAEAGAYLGRTTATIYNLIGKKKLRKVSREGRTFIRQSDLDQYRADAMREMFG